MKHFLTIPTLFLVIGLICSQIRLSTQSTATAAASAYASTCICPDYNCFTKNLDDPAVNEANSLFYTEKLWNSPYPPLTEKGKALKEAYLYLARSDVPRWRETATFGTVWIWGSASGITAKPVFCTATEIINATVNAVDGVLREADVRKVAASAADTLMDASRYINAATLTNTRCAPQIHTPAMSRCYQDGSVYPIKKYWGMIGDEYPCIFQRAVLDLYNSDDYFDRYLCAVTTASTAKLGKVYYDNLNKPFIYELFQMQTLSPIDPCCCDKLRKDLAETMAKAQGVADYSANKLLCEFGCN